MANLIVMFRSQVVRHNPENYYVWVLEEIRYLIASHLPENNPKRVNVCLRSCWVSAQKLRCSVSNGSGQTISLRRTYCSGSVF